MKFFFDTNVLISAFITPEGLCAEIFSLITKAPDHEVICGEFVLHEIERTLTQRFEYPRQEVDEVLSLLRKFRIAPKPAVKPEIYVADPDDIWILASALEAKADVLVTGDQDLLVLGDKAGIKIVTPRSLLDSLKTS